MSETLQSVGQALLLFLFGAGGLALINIAQERWKMRYQRKAQKEDKAEEKEDKLYSLDDELKQYIAEQKDFNERTMARFEEMEQRDAAHTRAMKYVLLDRIIYIGQSYIKHGEVSFDDRRRLREMHDSYHNDLGGNGDADNVMDAVDGLPLKQ